MTTKRKAGQSIQLTEDLAKPLQEFGKKAGMTGAGVARVILAFGLPRLIRGEMYIVNGELKESSKAA